MLSRRFSFSHPVFFLPAGCLILVLVEFQLDLVERLMGSYLRINNAKRPKVGWIAEVERKSRGVQKRLSDIVTELTETNTQAAQVSDLTELVRLLKQHSRVVMSRQQFLDVYTRLPRETAARLISPLRLLELSFGGGWSRTFITEGEDGGMQALLVDNRSGVLEEIPISGEQFALIEQYERGNEAFLDELDQFRSRIYSAEAFFVAFNGLPEGLRTEIVNDPFQLLEWRDNLKRVGIAEQSIGGVIEVGFEVEQGGRTDVMTFWGSETAVRYLYDRLNGPVKTESRADSTSVRTP